MKKPSMSHNLLDFKFLKHQGYLSNFADPWISYYFISIWSRIMNVIFRNSKS